MLLQQMIFFCEDPKLFLQPEMLPVAYIPMVNSLADQANYGEKF